VKEIDKEGKKRSVCVREREIVERKRDGK